jgi:hypothetical protein
VEIKELNIKKYRAVCVLSDANVNTTVDKDVDLKIENLKYDYDIAIAKARKELAEQQVILNTNTNYAPEYMYGLVTDIQLAKRKVEVLEQIIAQIF